MKGAILNSPRTYSSLITFLWKERLCELDPIDAPGAWLQLLCVFIIWLVAFDK